MPTPETVAIVVVGKAAELRPQLGDRFGPVETVQPEACEELAARD
jgi:hypothetical protein